MNESHVNQFFSSYLYQSDDYQRKEECQIKKRVFRVNVKMMSDREI